MAEDRPVASELFGRVADKRREFDAVCVLAVDRMFRDPSDELNGLAYLAKYECAFLSIRDPVDLSSPVGELQQGIMSMLRRFERRLIGQRVAERCMTRLLTGKFPGGKLPLGLRYDDPTDTILATERASDVITLFECYVRAGGSYRATARAMNRAGIPGADGGVWQASKVRRLIVSPAYRRRLVWRGQEVEAEESIPQVVAPELIAHADAIREHRAGGIQTRERGTRIYAYTGVLYCAECGRGLTVNGRGRDCERSSGYRCTGVPLGVCHSRQIAAKYLDRMIGQGLRVALGQYADEIAAEVASLPKHEARDTARTHKRLEERRRRTVDAWIEGNLDKDARDTKLREIDRELAGLAAPVRLPVDPGEARAWILAIDTNWADVPNEDKKALLLRIGTRITVHTLDKPRAVSMTFEQLPVGSIVVRLSGRR